MKRPASARSPLDLQRTLGLKGRQRHAAIDRCRHRAGLADEGEIRAVGLAARGSIAPSFISRHRFAAEPEADDGVHRGRDRRIVHRLEGEHQRGALICWVGSCSGERVDQRPSAPMIGFD